jgi:hypothetical protein
MVSPTRVSATCLDRGGEEADLAGAEFSDGISCLGRKTPTRSIW